LKRTSGMLLDRWNQGQQRRKLQQNIENEPMSV